MRSRRASDDRRVVLVLTPFLWTTGEDAGMPSAYRTLTGLRDAGWEVHVVLPSAEGTTTRDYRGLTLHTFGVPRFGLRGAFGPQRSALLLEAPPGPAAGIRWKAFLAAMLVAAVARGAFVSRRVRPNLLYGILPTGALAASLLRLLTRRPNVTRLFGTHLAPVHGVAHLAHAWEVAAFKAPAAALVVTDDGTLGDRVARRLRVPAERFHFLMNGVDETFADGGGPTRAEARASLALDDAVAVFVFAHHLIPQHHPAVFVEAVERVDGAVGLVAGDGPERPALEALAGDRVRLLGNVSRTEIRRLLAAADAVVSLDELSNVVNSVLEALALGVPVVATATGGTRALLADGESALLLERPDVATVADALRRVASDPDLRARLSAGARLVAAERLVTWDERMRIEDDLLRGIAC